MSCTPVLYIPPLLNVAVCMGQKGHRRQTDRQPVESGVDYEGMRTCPESSRRKRLVGSGRYPCPSVPVPSSLFATSMGGNVKVQSQNASVCLCLFKSTDKK